MKSIQKLLVPADLSENSRRGLLYACSLAAENNGVVTICTLPTNLTPGSSIPMNLVFSNHPGEPGHRIESFRSYPDLNHFLEPHLEALKKLPSVTKRIVLGTIAEQIVT